MVGTESVHIAVPLEDHATVGVAQTRGGGDQRIKHAVEIERRAADDLENVGGRGLLLQRFSQVASTRLNFVK